MLKGGNRAKVKASKAEMMRILAGLLFLMFGPCLQAQTIVNTETLMLTADSGFIWTAGVSGDFSAGNSDVLDVTSDAGFSTRVGKTTFKLIGSWNRLAQDGVSIQSSAFGHLRMEHGAVGGWQVFGFAQISSNDVLLMRSRNLMGGGLKRRIIDGTRGAATVSWGCFWEHEVYDVEVVPSQMLRNSFILSGRWEVTQGIQMRYTTYLQSDYRNWQDSRAFFEWTWDIAILDQVALEWNLGIRWDGDPHAGLRPLDIGSSAGLRFGFDGD